VPAVDRRQGFSGAPPKEASDFFNWLREATGLPMRGATL